MIGNLRSRIRRYRFFYKPEARSLYRRLFRNWPRAYLLPFSGSPLCILDRREGGTLAMPSKHWPMLAMTCGLLDAGARVVWHNAEIEVRLGDCTFRAPADCTLLGVSVRGLFLDDVWRLRDLDLSGRTAINVGGHIGMVAVALARKGAVVHAFEPFGTFADYLRRNARANNLDDRIHVHTVGLSDCCRSVSEDREVAEMASPTHGSTAGASLPQLVDATGYFEGQGIREAALLQMNCEGCEYAVLTQRFIDCLNPLRVHLEFHRGEEPLLSLLKKNGYRVDHCDRGRKKGKLFASR